MAEATRFKDLQEAQKKLDQVLHAESMKREATEVKLQEQIDGMNTKMEEKMEHLTHTLAEIQLQLLNINKGGGYESDSILGNRNFSQFSSGFQGNSGSKTRIEYPHHVFNTPAPKMEFPRFDGSNPRAWILKCSSYFKIIPNLLDQQKINLASMHFEGRALQWFQNLENSQLDITWEQFVDVISVRFEGIRESKVIVEFNKLRLSGSYLDYVDKFEELKSCMLLSNQNKFSEEYFIASFISGLSEELQSFVSMFKPTTLEQAIELGAQQIATLDIISKRMKTAPRPSQNPTTTYKEPDSNIHVKSSPSITLKPPTVLLIRTEMAARRQKGLCFNCDEPFTAGHRCKNRISYVMMTEEEELSYIHGELEPELENTQDTSVEEIHVSLNSIVGGTYSTTMRVEGETNGHILQILIDTGSTLSFLRDSTARKVGCQLEEVKPILVRVANGQKLTSTHKVTGFSWNIQGHDFTYTPRILGSEGYDMILGGDWLRHCTPVGFDYKKMTFTVHLNGRKVKLRAITSSADCLTEVSLYNMIHKHLDDDEEISILKDTNLDYTNFSAQISKERVARAMGRAPGAKYTSIPGLLRFRGTVVFSSTSGSRMNILYERYSSFMGAYMRLNSLLYWPEMKEILIRLLQECDDQIDRLNRYLENYIRCLLKASHIRWLEWLSLEEYFHSSQKCRPYQALYGFSPSQLGMSYYYLTLSHSYVYDIMSQRQAFARTRGENLLLEQSIMNHFAVKRRLEWQFQEGNQIYLKLQPFRQNSMSLRENLKPPFSVVIRKKDVVSQIVVQGLNAGPKFATWEYLKHIYRKFPSFDPCGQGSSSAGGIVMGLSGEKMDGKKSDLAGVVEELRLVNTIGILIDKKGGDESWGFGKEIA